MDPKVDPCTDFYAYACGGFLAANPVPDDGALVTRRHAAFFATQTAIDEVLGGAVGGELTSPEAKQLRAYATACMLGSANGVGLHALLARVEPLALDGGLPQAVAALHAAGVPALFGFDAELDLTRPPHVIPHLFEAGIGLPDQSYYLDAAHQGVLTAYETHVIKQSSLLGLGDPGLAAAVISIERELARAMLTAAERRDPAATQHPTQRSALATSWPAFDWEAYFTARGAPAFTSLNVTVPAFFAAVDAVLRTRSREDVYRYLRWRVIESLAMHLSEAVVAEEYRFHAGTFSGFSAALPREELCLRLTVEALPWEMGKLYSERHAAGLADRVQPLVEGVRDAMRDELARLDWLDDATREQVRRKLDAMRVGVAAPTDFGPYLVGAVDFEADFSGAELQRRAKLRATSLQLIGATFERDWFMAPTTVDAAYSAVLNTINVPAAVLQPPLWGGSFAEAVSHGALGALVGHEVMHGFDDVGRRFDENGALADTWSAAAEAAFDERAQCFVDQYGALEGTPGVKIDGRLTLGENIADLGGLKLALLGLAPTGERLGSLTDAQAFFLAYAQSWCTNARPSLLKSLLASDPHAPARERVNVVLQNTPEFADAFSCREGQPMAPARRCSLW